MICKASERSAKRKRKQKKVKREKGKRKKKKEKRERKQIETRAGDELAALAPDGTFHSFGSRQIMRGA